MADDKKKYGEGAYGEGEATGGTPPPNAPPLDPAVGHAAETAADQARKAAEESLTSGALDLNGLFTQMDQEDEAGTRVLGHMHARAALMALPHIGEKKSSAILDDLGIKHNDHLDMLGSEQRAALIQAVADAQPKS